MNYIWSNVKKREREGKNLLKKLHSKWNQKLFVCKLPHEYCTQKKNYKHFKRILQPKGSKRTYCSIFTDCCLTNTKNSFCIIFVFFWNIYPGINLLIKNVFTMSKIHRRSSMSTIMRTTSGPTNAKW